MRDKILYNRCVRLYLYSQNEVQQRQSTSISLDRYENVFWTSRSMQIFAESSVTLQRIGRHQQISADKKKKTTRKYENPKNNNNEKINTNYYAKFNGV